MDIDDPENGGALGLEENAEALLRGIANSGPEPVDIMKAALALASFDAPTDRLSSYHQHLEDMVRDVGIARGEEDTAHNRVTALNHVMFSLYGYKGDTENYDDLQNANLIRVIDRRKGLPVALGILMLHLARAQGWEMAGIDFPGHFLLRLDGPDQRVIVDPFHEGAVLDAAALRALLKAIAGPEAELSAHHYEAVGDIDVLLRLQNNIKLRLIQAQRIEEAAGILDTMLLLRPHETRLWRESGLLNAHTGRIRTALAALETYVSKEENEGAREEAKALMTELRSTLN